MRLHKLSSMVVAASVIVLMLLGTSSPTSAGIVNGSFEEPLGVGEPAEIPGWTVSSEGLGRALVETGVVGVTPLPTDGQYRVTLATEVCGSLVLPNRIQILQAFDATAGTVLSFDCWQDGMGHSTAEAFLDGNSLPLSGSDQQWKSFSAAITASGSHTLKFVAWAEGYLAYGPPPESMEMPMPSSRTLYVDNVRLVPEPSTLVLLGIGAISLLAWAWRRRRAT